MHILIIPSEEFIPKKNKLLGIFQYHQAKLLIKRNHKVGVISISLKTTLAHELKVLITNLFTKREIGKSLQNLAFLIKSLIHPECKISLEKQEGIAILRIDGLYFFPPYKKLESIFWNRYARIAIKEYIKMHGRPEILYAHNSLYAGVFCLSIKKLRIPTILIEHSSIIGMKKAPIYLNKKIRQSYSNPTTLLAVSNTLKESMLHYTERTNITVIGNTSDPIFENDWQNNKLKKFDFISIGSLTKLKNHQLIITAFSKFRLKYPNTHLIIVGKGDEFQNLEKLFKELKIPEASITFTGELDQLEIIKYLDNTKIYVHASNYETFGVSLIEAQLRGLPVITTNCGGPNMFIDSSNGLFSKGGSKDYSDTMIEMYEKYNRYNPTDIRQSIIEKFGNNSFTNKLEDIFLQTLASNDRHN